MPFQEKKKVVVLLSGGIDSATCCAMAKQKGFGVYALSFAYGQRHEQELEAAKRVASFLRVEKHVVVSLDLTFITTSSLIQKTLTVPKNSPSASGDTGTIPNTYVPGRNIIFLSYALSWAEVLACHDIFIGVTVVDYSGYPDCRPDFIRAFETAASKGTKMGVEHHPIVIHTPLITMSKADIIRTGVALGIDYGLTHSCYDPNPAGRACGRCDSCLIRKRGFAEAGIPDPTRYLEKEDS